MTGGFVTLEEDAAHDGPNDRGVGTPSPGTVYGEELTVCVEVIGHAEDGFELIFRFF
jgi:hypothetical protein